MDNARAVTVDIIPAKRPHVLADLESGLPFRDQSIANVVMFNVLEHVYNGPRLCAEVFRVLAPSGKCYIFVPFLYRIHDDPNDYFRYSQFALQRMLLEAGFPHIEVQPLGFGPFTTAWSFVDQVVPPWFLRAALTSVSIKLDRWLDSRTPHFTLAPMYPLACFATAAKG